MDPTKGDDDVQAKRRAYREENKRLLILARRLGLDRPRDAEGAQS